MAVRDKKILWSFMILLTGVVSQTVNYPAPVCAVKGSTVSLLCSFTPLQSVTQGGRRVQINIVRVRWCQNHGMCQGQTPSVYDSDSTNNDHRYKYLGDMKGNCTLQITDIQKRDNGTFRFRMEADNSGGHFTEISGVNVNVIDGTRMKIRSSSGDRKLRGGENMTLFCSALCTFHHLEVTWFKDNHTLSESGPTLMLSPLTAKDSGNYSCGLKTNAGTRSLPYSLHVEADEERDTSRSGSAAQVSLIVGVVFGVLLVFFTLIMVLCFIRRRQTEAADHRAAVDDEVEQKQADLIYSSVLPRDAERRGHQQETEDVNYASVQFKHKNQAGRRAEEAEDAAIIYSAVASRG